MKMFLRDMRWTASYLFRIEQSKNISLLNVLTNYTELKHTKKSRNHLENTQDSQIQNEKGQKEDPSNITCSFFHKSYFNKIQAKLIQFCLIQTTMTKKE